MRTTYRVLAITVCALVALQAAFHAWGTAGMGVWIDEGGVLDKATGEAIGAGERPWPELTGMILHGMSGMFVIPTVALLLVVVALVARFSGAVPRALLVLALVVVQVTLGLLGHTHPKLGFLHGINALLLFTAAFTAQRHARAVAPEPQPAAEVAGALR
jgi:heme A synthase